MHVTRPLPPEHAAAWSVGRKLVASVATLAVTGGLMGLATFGTFDDTRTPVTVSTVTHRQ